MAQEILKDAYGRIIGRLEQQGNRLYLYDFYHRKVGYYDSALNKTFEWNGKFVGHGNILMMLLKPLENQ